MTNTMRRVRSYQRATRRRKSMRMFQGKMLVHLVQARKAETRNLKREIQI